MAAEHEPRNITKNPADYLRGLVKNTDFYVHKTGEQTIVICTKSYSMTNGKRISRWEEDTILVFIDKGTADPERMMFNFYPYSDSDLYTTDCGFVFIIENKNNKESIKVVTKKNAALETPFGNVSVTSFDPAYYWVGPDERASGFYQDAASALFIIEKIAETIRKTRLPGLE